MAANGLERDWRKLNINSSSNALARSLESSRNPSNAASRNGSCSFDGPIIYADDSTGLESGGLNIKSSRNAPPLDLDASWLPEDDKRQFLSPVQSDDASIGRPRNKSISFDPEARLDNGETHALDRPLPRTSSLRSVSTADRPNSSRRMQPPSSIEFDPVACKINPFTGEPIARRSRRDTASTPMSIMDSLNKHDQQQVQQGILGQDAFASLTSGSTASPPQDEIHTPLSPSGSYISSPTVDSTPALSPNIEAGSWPTFRSGSVRSARTLPSSRPMNLRKEPRRASSKRSGSSSFSPASAFLSKWGRDSLASVAPEADDEGQSFGLNNEYVVGRQIGYGGFSVVKEAFSVDEDGNRTRFAVKIVRKNIQEKPDAENDRCQQELEHEVGIWKYLANKHILSLHAVFDTDFATFCVMDLNEGGSLYDLMRDQRKKDHKHLSAEVAKSYAFQLACALRYLHQDVRVVHRDVKMENCLIDLDSAQLGGKPGRLRLCDFGLADFIASDSPNPEENWPGNAANVVGSLEYAAPEAMKTEMAVLSPTVDIWAFGVCVYTLVTGDRPFKHSMASKLVDLISKATWDHSAVRESPTAKNHYREILTLLKGCLNPDAAKRWTIGQVLGSPWFGDCDDPYAM